MTEIQIKGTISRVQYRIRKLRVLQILCDDGKVRQVQLSSKMNAVLPNNLEGAEVEGTAYESWTPGFFITNYLGIKEPDVQPVLSYERPVVFVDSQEASINPKLLASLRDFCFDVATASLIGSGADLILSSAIAVQLKSNLDDLASSISDGRLYSELEELQSEYEVPILLIIAQAGRTQMNPASVAGMLASLARVGDRLQVYTFANRPDAMLFIRSLVRQEQLEHHHYPVLKTWRREQGLDRAKLSVLSELPGVGGKTALHVLKEKKTVEAATQMREIDWRRYVSKPKARDIEKVLREPVS